MIELQRFLLYEAKCAACTRAAEAVETISDGWVTAKPLSDPEAQELLERTGHGGHWEPMLVESDGEATRVWRGYRLRLKLARGVGTRRSLRIWRIVREAPTSELDSSVSRRAFLRRAAAAGSAAVFGGALSPWLDGSEAHGEKPRVLGRHSPRLKQLKRSDTVAQAREVFGAIDWNQVIQIRSRLRPGRMFALPFKRESEHDVRFLITNATAAQGRGSLVAVVARFTSAGDSHFPSLYCIDGEPFVPADRLPPGVPATPPIPGRPRRRRAGAHAASLPVGLDPICIGLYFYGCYSLRCAPGCNSCVLFKNPIVCVECAVCISMCYDEAVFQCSSV